MYQHLIECKRCAENMQMSFCFCKISICLKILENIQISVNMIDRLNITDEYSVKCDFILNTVIFIDAALNISLRKFENVMFYDFIYLAKGFRMRPKVRSTLNTSEIKKSCTYIFKNETIMLSDSLVISQMSWSSCDKLEKFLHDVFTSEKNGLTKRAYNTT